MVEIHRGEIPASLRLMAEWWGWSKNRVDKFLDILEKEEMIKKRTAFGTAQTVITICNYVKYNFIGEKSGQAKGQSRDRDGTETGQSRDNTNKDNNLKNEEEGNIYIPPKFNFSKILIENYNCDKQHVSDWLEVRKKKKASNTETALKNFINECQNNNFPVSEAVKICAERSWQGFKYEWLENLNFNSQSNGTNQRVNTASNQRTSPEQLMAAIASGFARADYDKSQRERGNID